MPCYGATEAVWCGQGRGQTFGAQTFGPLGAELSGRDARTSGSSASRHPPPLEAPSARRQRPRGCGCRLPLRERGRGRSTRQRSGLRRSSSFFSPLPREGVGGGPIITERSEASARRRPQPPERSRVAICLQKAAFANRTPLGLVLFAKAAFCERQDVTCNPCARSRSDREREAFPWERHPQTGEAITTYFQFSLDRC